VAALVVLPIELVLAPVVVSPIVLVLAPVLFVAELVLPVTVPPFELVVPPVELVVPPLIVPVVLAVPPLVLLVALWVVVGLIVGLIVVSDAFEAAEVPLWLLELVDPVEEDGVLVSPTFRLVVEHEVAVAGQEELVCAPAGETSCGRAPRPSVVVIAIALVIWRPRAPLLLL